MLQLLSRIRTAAVRDLPSVFVICVAAALQLFLVVQPFSFLLTNVLPDDAFYYFQIARHVLDGQGSTFDGIHPTNGYHPLWMLMLLPIFSMWSVGGTFDVMPIYAALGVSIVLNIGTALIVLRLIARVAKHAGVRALALAVFALNPVVLFEGINGLETSIAMLLVSLFFLWCVKSEEQPNTKTYVILGICAGFMVLARLDMAVYAVAFAAWLLVRYGMHGITRAVLTGAVALLIAAPWFIWNTLSFDMLLTSASNANVIINHALVVQDNGAGIGQLLKASAYLLIYHANDLLSRSGIMWFLFALLGAAAFIIPSESVLSRWRRAVPVLAALAVGFLALFFVNAGLRFTGRTWYFVSAHFFIALLAAWVLERYVGQLGSRTRIALAALSVLLAGSFFIAWHSEIRDQMAPQEAMYEMAQYMNEHLPAGTKVGVFNAGVQAYFSDMQIVNLDGLVNNSAYEAIRDARLWSYIVEEDIRYISDFDLYLSYRYTSFLDTEDVFAHLTPLTRIAPPSTNHGINDIALYSITTGK